MQPLTDEEILMQKTREYQDGYISLDRIQKQKASMAPHLKNVLELVQGIGLQYNAAITYEDYRKLANLVIQLADVCWAFQHDITACDTGIMDSLRLVEDSSHYHWYLRFAGYHEQGDPDGTSRL